MLENILRNFDCAKDENDFYTDIYYLDDIRKALKTLSGEWEIIEYSDRFEVVDLQNEEAYNIYFDEMELSIQARLEAEEMEQMRIDSYYW